eukprot:517785-Amphidinium_carterae.2
MQSAMARRRLQNAGMQCRTVLAPITDWGTPDLAQHVMRATHASGNGAMRCAAMLFAIMEAPLEGGLGNVTKHCYNDRL